MDLALLAPLNFVDSLLLKFFSEQTVNYVIWPFIQVGAVVTITALWVAYATYLERKISAFMQARLGPMRVGPWGLLQPIADGLKLLVKEDFIPENADRWIFFLAPYIAVVAAFVVMAVVPFGPDWAVITEFSTPAPDRFVRDITTFVPDGAGAWRRGHEHHENVLVDTSLIPALLAGQGVRAAVGTRFANAELPPGLRAVTGRKDTGAAGSR